MFGLENIFYVAEVVIGLGLLIFIHEGGHFLMAKYNNVRVEAFSLGFGQPIWKMQRGDTEYRIAWIPLGGYVKMAGETILDERSGDPGELTSKSPWARFTIFVAGALMNLVIAFPISVLAFVCGKNEISNEVAVPSMPETWAGMRPGDRVVEVDGRVIDSLETYRLEIVRRWLGTKVPVVVEREGERVELVVESMESGFHLTRGPQLYIGEIKPGSQAEKIGLQEGDEIYEVAGEHVYYAERLLEKLGASPGEPVELKWRRRDVHWNVTEMKGELTPKPKTVYRFPKDARVYEPIVGGVNPSAPAHDKLKKEDRILEINGRKIRSWQDLKEVVEPSIDPVKGPQVLQVKVERMVDKKSTEVTVNIRPAFRRGGYGALGIGQTVTDVVAVVAPGSYLEKAGLQSGDRLAKESDKEDAALKVSWADLWGATYEKEEKRTIEFVRDSTGKKIQIELVTEKSVEGDLESLGLPIKDGALDVYRNLYRRRPFGEAVSAGLAGPFDIGVLTFEVLGKLVSGQESMSNMGGPVGIAHATFLHARLSFGNLLWLLSLITVNLGIFNLLPIPILDGGHVVLLGIEVLRGRPPSDRFVIGFQYVGLFLILALVIMVTVNDISRFLPGG